MNHFGLMVVLEYNLMFWIPILRGKVRVSGFPPEPGTQG